MAETNQRTAYGQTLVELCHKNRNIVVLDADLGGIGDGISHTVVQRHHAPGLTGHLLTPDIQHQGGKSHGDQEEKYVKRSFHLITI